MLSLLARLIVLPVLLLAGSASAQEQEQPFFVQFRIERTAGEQGGATWLATYEEKHAKAMFVIAIRKPGLSSAFAKGTLRRVPGSQADLFLKRLPLAIGGKGKVPLASKVDALPVELAVLGTHQSRASHDGGFGSEPAGDWIAMKAFLADGQGEIYLNLNPRQGIGEFSLKDEEYADVVLRQIGSIL